MNKVRIQLYLTCIAIMVIGLACANMNGEKEVALEKTPAAVQASVQKVLGGQKADKIVMEDEDGKTIYEVTYTVNGQERSANVSPSGDILEQESEIDPSALPAAVSKAILVKYPGAQISETADVTEGGSQFYEADVTPAGGKTRELQVNSDGSIHKDQPVEQDKDEK